MVLHIFVQLLLFVLTILPPLKGRQILLKLRHVRIQWHLWWLVHKLTWTLFANYPCDLSHTISLISAFHLQKGKILMLV